MLDLTWLLVVALIMFIYIGWTYRTDDSALFHSWNHEAPSLRVFASLFTVVGASEFVVFTTLAYAFGIKATAFFLGTLSGFIALAFIAPSIRKRAKELDHHSMPDLFAEVGLPRAASLVTGLAITFTMSLVLIQVLIGAQLLDPIFVGGDNSVMLAIVIAIIGYLMWGGYQALLNTDVIQGAALFLFTVFLMWFLVSNSLVQDISVEEFAWPVAPPIDLIVLGLGGFFAILGGPEIWQRVLTARSDRDAQKSLTASGLLMLVWGGLVGAAGTYIAMGHPNANPDDAFFTFLASGLPAWLLGLVMLLLLVAILSTADTEIFAASVITRKEIRRWRRRTTPMNLRATRILLSILGCLVLLVAMLAPGVLEVYFSLVYLTFIIGPLSLALVLNRGGRSSPVRDRVMLWSGVAGAVLLAILVAGGLLLSWEPLLILLPSSIPLLLPGPSRDPISEERRVEVAA